MKKNYLSRDFILKTELLWYMDGHVYDRRSRWIKKLTVEILGNILLKIKWKR